MTELNPPGVHTNGGATTDNVVPTTTKRQRRPSVRLCDIGGDLQFYEQYQLSRRIKQSQWKPKSSSKRRPLLNLTTNPTTNNDENGKTGNNVETAAIGSWKLSDSSKAKKGSTTKRVRSNWRASSKTDEDDDKFSGGNDEDTVIRDLDGDEESDRESKEQSPIQSLDGDGGHGKFVLQRRDGGVRVSNEVELDSPSDNEARNPNNDSEKNVVKNWLNELGLGCYAPVFEIHEVDDEVLPLLTLEDLKDMGINAVGSRRKMYCSIQKLGKGFSRLVEQRI